MLPELQCPSLLPWFLTRTPQISFCLSPPLSQICKLPHLCGNGREQERRKKEKNPPTCQQTGKKNNPGLVSLSCWLAAPSYCGGCSCLLDRGLALCSPPSHPALAFVNPPPSISAMGREGPGAQGRRAGRKDWQSHQMLGASYKLSSHHCSPKSCRRPSSHRRDEVKEFSPTRQPLPQIPLPTETSAASLYHFMSKLCFRSNSLYSNLFIPYPFFTFCPSSGNHTFF